ncbi:MAG: hypothetical protein R2883_03810 [Caldisericia bacterium]
MIEIVKKEFVPGDVLAYIPKSDGGVHPVVLKDKTIHICSDRFRAKSLTSFDLPFEVETWMYCGSRLNTKDTFLPCIPIIDPNKIGTLIISMIGESDYWVTGLQLPGSSELSSFFDTNKIKSKFLHKTGCMDIIGAYMGDHFNNPTFTLQEPQCLSIYHHNTNTGRIVAEQTFKKKTVFPSYPRLSSKQIAYDGYNFLAFEIAENKYKFLWPLEIKSLYQESFNWQVEWDERTSIANIFDGENYHVIDLTNKIELIEQPSDEIGFGLNSTLYETKNSGLKWAKRYMNGDMRSIKFHTIEDGPFEAIDIHRTREFGDIYLFGQDTNDDYTVKVFFPNPKDNSMKIIEFTGLLDSVFYSEIDEITGELHLFSNNYHYKTAPLSKL